MWKLDINLKSVGVMCQGVLLTALATSVCLSQRSVSSGSVLESTAGGRWWRNTTPDISHEQFAGKTDPPKQHF